MKRDWLVLVGLVFAVGIILYFYADQYHRPPCTDIAAEPWMQGTVYDVSVGKCDER